MYPTQNLVQAPEVLTSSVPGSRRLPPGELGSRAPFEFAIDEGGLVYGEAGPAPERNEVEACTSFIIAFGERAPRVVRSELNSYSLKHAVEAWSRTRGGVPYVTNGAFIQAARELGVAFSPLYHRSINAHFALRWGRYRKFVRQNGGR